MARRTPTSSRAVLAISDARRALLARLAADGTLCRADDEALLLLDTAAYLAEKADRDRRRAINYLDYGEASPGLVREEREVERDFRHLPEAA